MKGGLPCIGADLRAHGGASPLPAWRRQYVLPFSAHSKTATTAKNAVVAVFMAQKPMRLRAARRQKDIPPFSPQNSDNSVFLPLYKFVETYSEDIR